MIWFSSCGLDPCDIRWANERWPFGRVDAVPTCINNIIIWKKIWINDAIIWEKIWINGIINLGSYEKMVHIHFLVFLLVVLANTSINQICNPISANYQKSNFCQI